MSEFGCDPDSKPPYNNTRQSLLSTLLWILSIVCVCLTATNLYLLVWVWTNLSLTSTNSVDLMSSSSQIRFDAQLRTKQAFRAAQIGGAAPEGAAERQHDGPGRPASTLSLRSPHAIHLVDGDNQQCAQNQCDPR